MKNRYGRGFCVAGVFTVSACGGGGGGSSPPSNGITVQGSASLIHSSQIAIGFAPQTLSPSNPAVVLDTESVSASLSTLATFGAYSGLGFGNGQSVSISRGVIADVAGNGVYSIGRWTNGLASTGSLSVNQGAHYVVGLPLSVPSGSGSFVCNQIAATSPTLVDGSLPPGVLSDATITLDRANNQNISGFSMDVTFDSGVGATPAPQTLTLLAPGDSPDTAVLDYAYIGTDPNNPLLALVYAGQLPATGEAFNGVAVLQCSSSS